MSFFKEEKSPLKLPEQLDESSIDQIDALSKLIKGKFSPRSFTININDLNSNVLEIRLLNARHGMDTSEVDDTNKDAIGYFQSLDGVDVHKEKAQHSYWSYSVVSFDRGKIPSVLQGLELLTAVPDHKPEVVCRC